MNALPAAIIEVSKVAPDGSAVLASQVAPGSWPREPSFRGKSSDEALWKKARELGLARARSASPAVWLAVCATAAVAPLLTAQTVCVHVVSTTATDSISLRFEKMGFEQGWRLVDPFWLPNTIPTGCPTAIMATFGIYGTALGFPGNMSGFFSALDHSLVRLASGGSERSLIVIAEDNNWMLPVLAARGANVTPRSGAYAIVLGRHDPGGGPVIVRDRKRDIDDPSSARKPQGAVYPRGHSYEVDTIGDFFFALKSGSSRDDARGRANTFKWRQDLLSVR